MRRRLLSGFFSLCLISQVSAHDVWANGNPVPDWVKGSCCGPNDVHSYEVSEIKLSPEGYIIPGYPYPVAYNKALPSMDGKVWAFFSPTDDGFTPVWCFFYPLSPASLPQGKIQFGYLAQ